MTIVPPDAGDTLLKAITTGADAVLAEFFSWMLDNSNPDEMLTSRSLALHYVQFLAAKRNIHGH